MEIIFLLLASICQGGSVELKVGDKAPLFTVKTHEDKEFKLEDRKGKWTILYFYPKAETPGCTKQACSFRDSLSKVKALNADVFGISTDYVESLKKFHENRKLNFTLLSDPTAETTKAYGAKMPLLKIAKRWTFLIDGELTIRHIDNDVDPVKDVENMVALIKQLDHKK